MSARDEMDTFLGCCGLSAMDRQKAQWFMADYAHELAEKIRKEMILPPINSEEMVINQVILGLATLIDPEVINA